MIIITTKHYSYHHVIWALASSQLRDAQDGEEWMVFSDSMKMGRRIRCISLTFQDSNALGTYEEPRFLQSMPWMNDVRWAQRHVHSFLIFAFHHFPWCFCWLVFYLGPRCWDAIGFPLLCWAHDVQLSAECCPVYKLVNTPIAIWNSLISMNHLYNYSYIYHKATSFSAIGVALCADSTASWIPRWSSRPSCCSSRMPWWSTRRRARQWNGVKDGKPTDFSHVAMGQY